MGIVREQGGSSDRNKKRPRAPRARKGHFRCAQARCETGGVDTTLSVFVLSPWNKLLCSYVPPSTWHPGIVCLPRPAYALLPPLHLKLNGGVAIPDGATRKAQLFIWIPRMLLTSVSAAPSPPVRACTHAHAHTPCVSTNSHQTQPVPRPKNDTSLWESIFGKTPDPNARTVDYAHDGVKRAQLKSIERIVEVVGCSKLCVGGSVYLCFHIKYKYIYFVTFVFFFVSISCAYWNSRDKHARINTA